MVVSTRSSMFKLANESLDKLPTSSWFILIHTRCCWCTHANNARDCRRSNHSTRLGELCLASDLCEMLAHHWAALLIFCRCCCRCLCLCLLQAWQEATVKFKQTSSWGSTGSGFAINMQTFGWAGHSYKLRVAKPHTAHLQDKFLCNI